LRTTECSQTSFSFATSGQREVVARFDGGTITTEAGALLLHKTEQKTRLLRQFAGCFTDHRAPDQIEHSVSELVRQRIYGLALLSRFEANRIRRLICLQHEFELGRHYTVTFPEARILGGD